MNHLQIRQANLEDLSALQEIGQQTILETYVGGNTEENMAAYLEEGFSEQKLGKELRNENSQFYFAIQADEVIGYIKVNLDDAQRDVLMKKTLPDFFEK